MDYLQFKSQVRLFLQSWEVSLNDGHHYVYATGLIRRYAAL